MSEIQKDIYKQNIFIETIKERENDIPIIIGETYGIDKGSCMLHYHECIEICYVRQGTGTHLIDGIEYSFQAGDIFVIGSNEIHLAYNDKDVIMLVVLFMPTLLYGGAGYSFETEYIHTFQEARSVQLHKIQPGHDFYEPVLDALMEMLHENIHKNLGYELVIKATLLKMAANIKRYFKIENRGSLHNDVKKFEFFLPVFDYIKENYSNKIKIEELSSLVNMSVSNFNLVFKKSTGSTPTEYINKYRIVKASQMLLETDKKIIDIAEDSDRYCRRFRLFQSPEFYRLL
ncbi:MAG: transcriptional regulator, AraC family [Eubacterium sp.]|nr:transcriptional regulator, AraC family [Eubacterium sp.]